jgi:predicted TIM-barrel enzyme
MNFPDGVIYYGGAAFKGQSQNLTDAQLVYEVLQAAKFVDVITTSGLRTGVAPDVRKLMQIAAIPPFHTRKEFPLAVASGVDVTNVGEMLLYVDHFLVASSVTTGDNLVMGGSVAALSRVIHAYKG